MLRAKLKHVIDTGIAHGIEQLLGVIQSDSSDKIHRHETVRAIFQHCERINLAWPVLIEAQDIIDRRGAILAGPLFTSVDFPWPAEDGRWLEPVLQIHLPQLGLLKGVNLGTEWLQIWAWDRGAIVRLVPSVAVAGADITPVPSQQPKDYHRRLLDIDPARETPFWLPGHAISGFDQPFLDYGAGDLSYYVEELLGNRSLDLPSSVLDAAQKLLALIDADERRYTFQIRAFGMMNDSSPYPFSAPPVLFVLEDGTPPLRESANGDDAIYVSYEISPSDSVSFGILRV
ncbi:hypothetical protein CP98_04811 [Sphingobium yanoikuyae]|jgi:hypothetical protein|uniref:DUF1963 domain-containing protein n=1 Tax=Sphingobium yanoikuyae TaxID=13690 RepID=A0A084E9C4_SPHYA|nr:hypothetical protein CP98_04811 [Sphingobium yanoikuyae]PZU66789.1 MAG: hypothetical protein DI546_22655 [Rhizobium sp.]